MDILEQIDSMRDEIVASLQEVVRIKSVESAALPEKPFGQGVDEVYRRVLTMAEKMGFQSLDVDGYAGHVDFGQGDEVVGVLAHLDVVPEGTDWTYPPYGAEIHDGKMYGRGTADDKGPVIAVLYAMKAIQKCGIPLKRKLRLILGLNEETGWECVKHYFARVKAPDVAFTPDAMFPAIHGEKGIVQFALTKKLTQTQSNEGIRLETISGGMCVNAAADRCTAELSYDETIEEKLKAFAEKGKAGMDMEICGDRIKIYSRGISAHGSMPEQGENAIGKMYLFLHTLPLADGDVKEFVKFFAETIGMEYYGQHIGCYFEDEDSGRLTFNVGMTSMSEDQITIQVDIRYPITCSLQSVEDGIRSVTECYGVEYTQLSTKPSIYIPKDSDLVKKLMSVYGELTGDQDSEAVTIGGGTYARALKNCVAFGPVFPGQPELAHQKDECVAIDDLILWTKIYAKALVALAE